MSLAMTAPSAVRAQSTDEMLVYHQITSFPEGTGSVGYPVLSADGTTAVFSDAPGTGELEEPNRIMVIGADGEGMREIDSYQSLCYCGAMVDITADGSTVVSSEGLQVRIADGSGAEELVLLASGEITALVITGDGETIFFLVRRDTATADGATIERGVWAIDASGDNLRLVAGAGDVAEAMGVAIEATGCCFHGDGHPLDVSDDGGQVAFGAYADGAEHVFAVAGEGGEVRPLRESVTNVMRVAISGDGEMVSFDVMPPDTGGINEVGVVPFGGGTPEVLAENVYSGFDEPLQLNADGEKLLISPNALLIDTASGETRLLATSINGVGGNHEAVLTDGLARVTMNAEADRFLYAIRTVRCADCVNLQEQLATLDIAPASLGEAPGITGASIEPATIGLERTSDATVEVTVDASSPVLGVGFAALLDSGAVDANVMQGGLLLDDGTNGDATANDGVYTLTGIVHAYFVVREDDAGPRTVRIAAEVTDSEDRRHATAVDIGTLTVSD
jgi:hypothetical protein